MNNIYLNGTKVDKLPPEALEKMSERLSYTVSAYFQRHPEEYESFLEGRKEMLKESGRSNKKSALHGERQAVCRMH